MLEKPLPQMVGTATKAGDKDVGIDEPGHLRLGIEGFHGGREWSIRSMERRVINGTEGRHPFSGVGGCRVLVLMGGQTPQLLRRPVGERFAIARGKGVKPQLQPVIEIENESAHVGENR